MEWFADHWVLRTLVLAGVGLLTGFVNTVAGGGSLLTLPILIFMGLSHTHANGTNRVGILLQSVGAVAGFRNQKVSSFPLGFWQGIMAAVGAVLGALLAVEINAETFRKVFAFIIVMVVTMIVFNPKPGALRFENSRLHNAISLIAFVLVGIYGGFIQAGVGFLSIFASTVIDGVNLHRANHAKVFATFCISVVAISIFIYQDLVLWSYGLPLAMGGILGSWFAGNYSVKRGEGFVKAFLLVMAVVMAVKLLFYP